MDGEVGMLIEKTGSNSFPRKSPLTFLFELPPYVLSMKSCHCWFHMDAKNLWKLYPERVKSFWVTKVSFSGN